MNGLVDRDEIEKYLAAQFGQQSVAPEQMQAAQAQAGRANTIANVGSALSSAFNAGARGQLGDSSSYWNSIREQGMKPLDDLQAKVKGDDARKMQVAQYLQGRFDKSDDLARQEKIRTEDLSRQDLKDAEGKRRWEAEQALRVNAANAKANGPGGVKLTKGQEAVDREFAKIYAQDRLAGGGANLDKNIEQLNESINKLDPADKSKSTDMLTGPGVSMLQGVPLLGKSLGAVFTPSSVDLQDNVRNVVQGTMKETLGAQFTEKEGERVLASSFNPALDEKTNADRLRRYVKSLEKARMLKKRASDYFEANGTMANYKGPLSDSELADMMISDIKGGESGQKQAQTGPKTETTSGGGATVRRKDPATGKIAIFDADTKQFIKYEGE